MLDALKTVYGAVEERALLSALSHVHVYDGRVQASSGRLTIDAPIPQLAGMTFSAPAEKFVAAITAAGDTPRVVRDGPVVRVTGNSFRAKVPTLGGEWAKVEPDPPTWETEEALLPVLARLYPFMADDATNVWATCLLLSQKEAVATNNVCLIGAHCTMLEGTGVDHVAVPRWTVEELLRLKMEPTGFGITPGSITFYCDDIWIKTQLVVAERPVAKVNALLAQVTKAVKLPLVPEAMLPAVLAVLPFCKEPKFPVVILGPDGVTTEEHDFSAAVAGIKLPEFRCNAKMLTLVLNHATHLGLLAKDDKDRVGFRCADKSRGILMGLRA